MITRWIMRNWAVCLMLGVAVFVFTLMMASR